MPYKNFEITPSNTSNQVTDQQSQFYKGFSTVDENSQSTRLYDFDLIQQDIINIFQTKKGERVMNPDFGTIIWGLIYEPFTDDVKQLISEDITRILNSDPRATPTQILITEAEYGMIVEATLYYTLQDVSQQMILTFDKELGLVTQ
jgi:phage baseplate assembly protein W